MKDLFASDYGVIRRDFFSVGYVSNAAELLRSDELYRILRLCGVDVGEGGETSSDWELFFSFCKVYPMLCGHLVATRLGTLLRERLALSLPPSEENAERLWRESTAYLSRTPLRAHELLPHGVPWLCDGEEIPDTLPTFVSPMLDAAVLAARSGETREAWHTRILSTVGGFAEKGCAGVVIRLGADYAFSEPNPYAVDGALSSRRRDKDASDLLTSQLVRETSEACVACGLPLTLECDCDASVGRLLRYVHRTVGLPTLCASAREPSARDALLALASEAEVRIALRLSDTPTEAELSLALESVAARYPIGRVRLITGADLRQSAVAQRDAERLLRRITEKSL